VTVTPAASSVLAGATVQLAATTKDAGGNTLNGRTVTWSTSNGAVATVSPTGLVTTVTAGSVTITATAEARTGTATVEVVNPLQIPTLIRPFALSGEYQTTNYFDHDIPKEFVDNNGTYLPWWGENSLLGIDGHSGYDWRMATGTPIVAAAAGTVAFAGNSASFFCP
jgi:murein DD-endopeptidase MepM/ murein hydrolase activator NlpD